MNTDEKILKALENLQAGQKRIEKDVKDLKQGQERLEQGQAQHKTALEALAAGQQDLRERTATKKDVDTAIEVAEKELRADILLIDAKLVKTVHSHGKRIENIEQHEGIQNPDKN